jgi:hypothetical protein
VNAHVENPIQAAIATAIAKELKRADLQISCRGGESAHGRTSDVREEFELSITWLCFPEKLVFGL